MLTAEHIIKNAEEDAIYDMISDFGIYAVRVSWKEAMIVATDCLLFKFIPTIGLWYIPHNKRNIIEVTERPFFIPYRAIQAIAFNEKPKEDEKVAII